MRISLVPQTPFGACVTLLNSLDPVPPTSVYKFELLQPPRHATPLTRAECLLCSSCSWLGLWLLSRFISRKISANAKVSSFMFRRLF